MKRIALLCVVLAASGAAMADLKSEINAMNAKVAKLFMKKDIDGFVKYVKPMVTSDFKHVEYGKSQTFDEMVATMRQGMAMLTKMTEVSAKVSTLKITGNTAVSTGTHTMAGYMIGEDKKKHTLKFSGVSTDNYRKEGGKWKLAKMSWSNQKMWMDGKLMDPSQMGGGN